MIFLEGFKFAEFFWKLFSQRMIPPNIYFRGGESTRSKVRLEHFAVLEMRLW